MMPRMVSVGGVKWITAQLRRKAGRDGLSARLHRRLVIACVHSLRERLLSGFLQRALARFVRDHIGHMHYENYKSSQYTAKFHILPHWAIEWVHLKTQWTHSKSPGLNIGFNRTIG